MKLRIFFFLGFLFFGEWLLAQNGYFGKKNQALFEQDYGSVITDDIYFSADQKSLFLITPELDSLYTLHRVLLKSNDSLEVSGMVSNTLKMGDYFVSFITQEKNGESFLNIWISNEDVPLRFKLKSQEVKNYSIYSNEILDEKKRKLYAIILYKKLQEKNLEWGILGRDSLISPDMPVLDYKSFSNGRFVFRSKKGGTYSLQTGYIKRADYSPIAENFSEIKNLIVSSENKIPEVAFLGKKKENDAYAIYLCQDLLESFPLVYEKVLGWHSSMKLNEKVVPFVDSHWVRMFFEVHTKDKDKLAFVFPNANFIKVIFLGQNFGENLVIPDSPYASYAMTFDYSNNQKEVYANSLVSGVKQLVASDSTAQYNISPTGKFIYWVDTAEQSLFFHDNMLHKYYSEKIPNWEDLDSSVIAQQHFFHIHSRKNNEVYSLLSFSNVHYLIRAGYYDKKDKQKLDINISKLPFNEKWHVIKRLDMAQTIEKIWYWEDNSHTFSIYSTSVSDSSKRRKEFAFKYRKDEKIMKWEIASNLSKAVFVVKNKKNQKKVYLIARRDKSKPTLIFSLH